MKSPDNDYNVMIYTLIAVLVLSLVVAFVFGMWVGVRLDA